MADDDARLRELGYTEQLRRAMGGFSSFALAFSVISIVTGIVSAYGLGLAGGGAGLGVGWPLVTVGALLVAAAMAELASAFPTAGALYHWSSLLGGRGWGWGTAMINLAGQIAVVATIDLGFAQGLVFDLGASARLVVPVVGLVVASHVALNLRSMRAVALANDASAVVQVVGAVTLAALLFVFGRVRPLSFLLELPSPALAAAGADGASASGGFFASLLLGLYTMTGFDAAAHAAEETQDAALKAPRGIVSAVAVSGAAGYVLVVALGLATGDLRAAAVDAHPALFVLRRALGDSGGRAAMALALVAMWFCGLSALTGLSRTLFAFARDGGLPRRLALVSPASGVPGRAVVAAGALALGLVGGIALADDAVFVTVASLATTALYLSYAIPVALGVRARLGGTWTRRGPWTLGRAGTPVAVLATTWTGFVLVVCSIPPNTAGAALLGALLVAIFALWKVWAERRFPGAPVKDALLR